MTAMQLVN